MERWIEGGGGVRRGGGGFRRGEGSKGLQAVKAMGPS